MQIKVKINIHEKENKYGFTIKLIIHVSTTFIIIIIIIYKARPRETNWSSKNGSFADGFVTLSRKTKYS